MAAVLDLASGKDPLRDLSGQFLDQVNRPDRHKLAYGIYYVASDSEFAPLCRFVERDVFNRVFGNDEVTMDREYDRYEAASFFILAMDHRAVEPAGVIRVIRPSRGAQKTIQDLSSTPEWSVTFGDISRFHRDAKQVDVWDIATLAVRSDWTDATGNLVSAALYHGTYLATIMCGSRHWIFALDEKVADVLRAVDVPMRRVCDLPAIEYIGSPATGPYILHMDELLAAAKVAGPRLRLLVFGEGLYDHVSLPPIDLRADGSTEPTALEPQGDLTGTGVASGPASVAGSASTEPATRVSK